MIGDGVALNIIPTDKFKTNCIAVRFLCPMAEETAALNSLLPPVLKRGCDRLQTMSDIVTELQMLYGSELQSNVGRVGDMQYLGFTSFPLRDEYTEGMNVTGEILSLMSELINKPLIENGTLKVGDSVIVGSITGKVRAMMDDKGRKIAKAGPSTPVSIMGLEDVPNAGDVLFGDDNEKLIKQVAEERRTREREGMIKTSTTVSLDDVFSKIKEGEMKVLNIIVKADVQGSSEAVKQSLEKLSNDQVRVNVIHSAVGAIKESDIMLAESSNAVIIGFNVRPDSNAKQISEKSGVDIKLYRIIYEAIEDVEKALKGMLAPKFTEVYLGKAEVRDVFKISGVGQVAGCYVVDGKIIRSGKLRIYRDDVMITEGNVLQLKRFKDDVKEVAYGFECGISIERFNDIKVGDFIECYLIEETKE
jgi:translation initiation factor IF-2